MFTTHTHMKTWGMAALAVVLMTALAACSSSSAAETTAAPAVTAPAPVTINVELGADSESMFMNLSEMSVAAGEVTFVVTNSDTREHEFVVLRTDLNGADLPFDEAADEMVEDGDGVTAIDEIEGVQAGETMTLTVNLEAGHHVFVCNLEGHYRKGMWTDFDVTG